MDELSPNRRDRLVSIARATASALPLVGGVVSELLTETIPELRFDRIVNFLRELDDELKRLNVRLDHVETHLRDEMGLDLLEEGVLQASRAVSTDRKTRLARLVARSLSREELEYEQSRTLLNIYRDLTDPEIVWLLFYSMNPTLGPGPHRDWAKQHPDILMPISKEINAPREQHERAAIQDMWKENLERLGLIRKNRNVKMITTLGRMLVQHIHEDYSDSNES